MLNLADLDRAALAKELNHLGAKPFCAVQLYEWIYKHGVTDFSAMNNLSKALRAQLAERFTLSWPTVKAKYLDEDGTCKWVLELSDGYTIETVYIPDKGRGTLCVSSQVGCAVGCAFCATGSMGFRRNLTLSEIIGQLKLAIDTYSTNLNQDHAITNVVFMGMGEPLLNLDTVLAAIDLMLDDHAYGLSKYRVTVSTSGVLPQLAKLQASEVALAISLHATQNSLRDQLVPMNRAYPIEKLLAFCDHYYTDSRRAVTIEYIMINELNDSLDDAKRLAKLLANGRYKVNLIPFNDVSNAKFKPSTSVRLNAFRDYLMSKGLTAITRRSRGSQIAAACGQLVQQLKEAK